MCLDTVYSEQLFPKAGYGWKTMVAVKPHTKDNPTDHIIYYGIYYGSSSEPIKPYEWVEATHAYCGEAFKCIIAPTPYKAGFHLWPKKPDLSLSACANKHTDRHMCLARVQYDEAHTEGVQDGETVIVANKMRVIDAWVWEKLE